MLRVLRRTGVAHEAEADTVRRLLDEVHPSQDDLLAALSDAMAMAENDPARARVIALLTAALKTGRFRPS